MYYQFCVHTQLWTNIFFNETEQIRYKITDDGWTFDCSLADCNVNIYIKYCEKYQKL
jgi:hypothetical protein